MQRTMGESPGKSWRAKCIGARCVGPKSLNRTTRLFVPYVDIIKGRGGIEDSKLVKNVWTAFWGECNQQRRPRPHRPGCSVLITDAATAAPRPLNLHWHAT